MDRRRLLPKLGSGPRVLPKIGGGRPYLSAGIIPKSDIARNFWPIDAADFDGTDYLSAGAIGMTDSKQCIFSAWVCPQNLVGSGQGPSIWISAIFDSWAAQPPGDAFQFQLTVISHTGAGGPFGFNGGVNYNGDSHGANFPMYMQTAENYVANAWYHLLLGWDLNTGAAKMFVNDIDVTNVVNGPINEVMPFSTQTLTHVGSLISTNNVLDGGLAEIWVGPNKYLDFSVPANRRKFISADKHPVDLGTDGSKPTGVTPAFYLHLGRGEAPANFATNRTGGTGFSVTGTLTTFPTTPSL